MVDSIDQGQKLIDQLAEEFVERLRRGERPAIPEYAERYPELGDKIRSLFPTLVLMEQLKPGSLDELEGLPTATDNSTGLPAPQLGDFRVIREVGRGGMGVVYEAEQVSLGRRVALKVLPKRCLRDDLQRNRFQREARAAARLHHTNIVPVFGVGEQDTVLYYVMQFIQGQGLDVVLLELKRLRKSGALKGPGDALRDDVGRLPHTPVNHDGSRADVSAEEVAQSLMTGEFRPQVIASCDDAASTTVLQLPASDQLPCKPQVGTSDTAAGTSTDKLNRSGAQRLVDQGSPSGVHGSHIAYWQSVARIGQQVAEALEYAHEQGIIHRDIKPANLLLDTRGTVWVTDFGLAKAKDQQDLTQSGDVLGTLRYMAPEQFQGKGDIRSDVYSLGMTLYELLVLRPAHEGSDRGQLAQKVLHESPPRLRAIDPSIPRDLETIVQKAIDRDPVHRYATAQALAEDLQRFERGETIRARPLAAWEKTWKWCRRNPVLASLSVAVLMLLVVVTSGSLMSARVYLGQRNSLFEQQEQVTKANREGQEKLARALLDQARANRLSRRVGQRYESLKLLKEATRLARELNLPPAFFDELRNEAIATMALADLRLAANHPIAGPAIPGIFPDGRLERALYWDPSGRISVRRMDDGSEICSLPGKGYDGSAWFSPDARFVAAIDDQLRYCVWNVEGPKAVKHLDAEQGLFEFSPDSRQVANYSNGKLTIFDLVTRQPIQKIPLRQTPRHAVFHPTLPRIAVTMDRTVELFDVATAASLEQFQLPARVDSLAWHPTGTHLAAGTGPDQQVHIWNMAEKCIVKSLENLPEGTFSAFDPSGDYLATSGWDHMTRLFHWRTGELLFKTENPVGFVRFSRDGRFLGPAVQHGKVGYWKFHAAREHQLLVREMSLGHGNYIKPAISPDGRLLFVTTEGGVGAWELGSGRELGLFSESRFLDMDPSGSLLTSFPGTWRWPIRKDAEVSGRIHLGPPERLSLESGDIAVSRDGTVVAVSQSGGALLVKGGIPEQRVVVSPHADCRYVAVSPDGRFIATGSHYYAGVKIWDAQNGKLVKELLTDEAWIRPVFSPDGQWLLTNQSNKHASRLWRVGTWKEGPDTGEGGFGSAFSPDSKTLAIGTTRGVRLVSVSSGTELTTLEDPQEDRPEYCLFSPDSTKLIVVSSIGRKIHVWDLRLIGQQLHELGLDGKFPTFSEPAPALLEPLVLQIHWGEIGVSRHLQIANQHLAAKKYSEAITESDAGLKLASENAELWHLRGRGRSGLKEFEAAAADYTQAIKFMPEHIEAHHYRGHARVALKNYAEAAVDFEFAAQRKPDDPHLFDMIGLYRRHLGNYEEATGAWRKSIALKPEPATQNDLARLLLLGPEKTRNPSEALILAEQAVKADAKRMDWLATLGIAYYRLDRLEEATMTLEKSAASYPDKVPPIQRFFQAMAWHKRSDAAKARQLYDQAASSIAALTTLSSGDRGLLELVQAEAKSLLGLNQAHPSCANRG